jgi:hypothetical protein
LALPGNIDLWQESGDGLEEVRSVYSRVERAGTVSQKGVFA